MRDQHMNSEEVEERLRAYFRAEEGEMEAPPQMWERLSPRLGEQKRVRRLLRLPFDDFSLTRRGKRYGVLVSILGVMILVGVILLPRPWGSGSLTPAATFAAAFEDLRTVESVYVVVDEYRSRLMWLMWVDEGDTVGLRIQKDRSGGPGWMLKIAEGEWVEEDCVQDGTFRECVVTEKATGGTVGLSQATGGRRIAEEYIDQRGGGGCGTLLPDHDRDRPLSEGIRESSRGVLDRPFLALIPGVHWRMSGLFDQPIEGGPALPSLLDEYGSAQRLDDTDLDGVRVEHYRAERAFDEGGSEVVELWLDKEDRLARKLTRKGDWGPDRPDTHYWDSTYTFSNINEPLPDESLMTFRYSEKSQGVSCTSSSFNSDHLVYTEEVQRLE